MNELIFNFLKKAGPVKRDSLLMYLHEHGHKITDREMRKIIEYMVVKENYPIGSSHKRGYFIVNTANDLDCALADLKSKGKAIFNRANSLYKNYYGREIKQTEIFN